jgi:deazaflavin-dependent oxidoreductase (nitroreductase family)
MSTQRRSGKVTGRGWRRRGLGWTVAVVVLLRLATIAAFRSRQPAVLDPLRQANKMALNPLMLHLAGKRHWYAAKVEHVGRRSGRPYETPVIAVPVEGGLAIPLPYGQDTDWCRNLQAAGGGVVVRQGRRHTVSEPVVVPTDRMREQLPGFWRRSAAPYGIASWLRVRAS